MLLLHRPEGSACETMVRCKGATRPEAAALGTVRSLAENVVLNLVHCPDDPVRAARELSIVVGADAARLGAIPAADRAASCARQVGRGQCRPG